MDSGPKSPARDPSGEVTPQRKSTQEGGRKTAAEHLIHREAESDARIGERRPESTARETSDGSLRKEEEKGYRNTDEV
jgi:hypothetical protein